MSFLKKIYSGELQDPTRVIGYSEDEVAQIERLYDINIKGDFRDFMLEMGRCSGGLFGDEIVFYRDRSNFPVRRNLLAQVFLFEEISNLRLQKLHKAKPFNIARISETQYFYILTSHEYDDIVCHYDENYETVKPTGKSFLEFMKEQADYYGSRQKDYICQGELIKF